jgi:hypothetical protein
MHGGTVAPNKDSITILRNYIGAIILNLTRRRRRNRRVFTFKILSYLLKR